MVERLNFGELYEKIITFNSFDCAFGSFCSG
jgi:hypothetical protein